MLTIVVPEQELFDDEKQEFHIVEGCTLDLEHSLVSLSKWESKFQKPFLGTDVKSPQELMDYIETMILTPNYPQNVASRFSQRNLSDIHDYIESTQSATTFGKMPERKGKGEIITSELIYYWMVAFQIPFETETWHLNRLFSLIRVCNAKNSKPKKMSRSEMAEQRHRLNAERRAKHNTSG